MMCELRLFRLASATGVTTMNEKEKSVSINLDISRRVRSLSCAFPVKDDRRGFWSCSVEGLALVLFPLSPWWQWLTVRKGGGKQRRSGLDEKNCWIASGLRTELLNSHFSSQRRRFFRMPVSARSARGRGAFTHWPVNEASEAGRAVRRHWDPVGENSRRGSAEPKHPTGTSAQKMQHKGRSCEE